MQPYSWPDLFNPSYGDPAWSFLFFLSHFVTHDSSWCCIPSGLMNNPTHVLHWLKHDLQFTSFMVILMRILYNLISNWRQSSGSFVCPLSINPHNNRNSAYLLLDWGTESSSSKPQAFWKCHHLSLGKGYGSGQTSSNSIQSNRDSDFSKNHAALDTSTTILINWCFTAN